jgi:hypothetical protein
MQKTEPQHTLLQNLQQEVQIVIAHHLQSVNVDHQELSQQLLAETNKLQFVLNNVQNQIHK